MHGVLTPPQTVMTSIAPAVLQKYKIPSNDHTVVPGLTRLEPLEYLALSRKLIFNFQ